MTIQNPANLVDEEETGSKLNRCDGRIVDGSLSNRYYTHFSGAT